VGEYAFYTRQAILERIERQEYVQVAPTVLGDLYATVPEDYRTEGISMLPVISMAVPVFRQLPFASLRIIYVLPPDFDSWQARISSHHFTPKQLYKRLDEAVRSLDFAIQESHCLFLVNDEFEAAVDQFCQLVRIDVGRGAQASACLTVLQQKGRTLADLLYHHARIYLKNA
jgi:guanylate kinase